MEISLVYWNWFLSLIHFWLGTVWKVCLLSLYKCHGQRGHYISKLPQEKRRDKESCGFKKECCLHSDCYLYAAQIRRWLQNSGDIPGLGTWKQVDDCMYVCVCHQIKGRGEVTTQWRTLVKLQREGLCVVFPLQVKYWGLWGISWFHAVVCEWIFLTVSEWLDLWSSYWYILFYRNLAAGGSC